MSTRTSSATFIEHAQPSLAECTQFLCARRAGFPEILQFLRATLAQKLRDIDARRALFSHLDAHLTRGRAAAALFGSRNACWPISGNFSARGALKFREICTYFERLLRKICVILARHSSFFAFQRSADSVKSFNDVLRVAQRTLAECTQILCARCAEIPEILQNFRAISAQSLRDLNAGRALVRMSTHL